MRTDIVTVDGSKLIVGDEAGFRRWVAKASDGEYLMEIRPLTQQARTLAQNRRLWKLYDAIHEQTGQDKDDLHEYFKARFLSRPFFLMDKDGVIRDEKVVPGSTRKLLTVHFGEYMDSIESLASEVLGCELLPMDEVGNVRQLSG